jgi:hypothetical protein
MLTDTAQGERLQRILQAAESGSVCTIRDLALEFDMSPRTFSTCSKSALALAWAAG